MTNEDNSTTGQLGFDALLADADSDNRAHKFERETSHLPDTMDEALLFYRDLIKQNHAAMLVADVEESNRLHEEANKLALRLNNGNHGIIAGDDAPGCVLERETAAKSGEIPLWGQAGDFVITVDGMDVGIEISGMYGLSARFMYWPGFSARATDNDRPFISETGYRSFLGISAEPQSGLTPDTFTRKAIAAHIEHELKGKLVKIADRYLVEN